mgnify:CR=1 FL=1
MSKLNSSNNINCSKVIGIQFSILSPDEIRKGSVAEITSRDTYINNKPVIGGFLLACVNRLFVHSISDKVLIRIRFVYFVSIRLSLDYVLVETHTYGRL